MPPKQKSSTVDDSPPITTSFLQEQMAAMMSQLTQTIRAEVEAAMLQKFPVSENAASSSEAAVQGDTAVQGQPGASADQAAAAPATDIHALLNSSQVMSPIRFSTTLKVPRLEKGADFENWSSTFMAMMEIDNLGYLFTQNFVNPVGLNDAQDATLRRHKAHARAMLMNSVDESFLEIIRTGDDGLSPGPSWWALKQHFVGSSAYDLRSVLQQLLVHKQGEDSLTSYIDKLNLYCTRLAAGNKTVSNENKLVYFLTGLHERYSNFKDVLEAPGQDLLTYEQACTAVIAHHRRKFGDPTVAPGKNVDGIVPSALLAGATEQGRKQDRDCYNCSKPGHMSRDCTRPCGICGSSEHRSNTCAQRKGKGKGKATRNDKCATCGGKHSTRKCRNHLTCVYCNKQGHLVADCRKKARDNTKKASGQATIAVNNAGDSNETTGLTHHGWLAMADSQSLLIESNARGEQSKCYSTATTPLLSWVADSGCTTHLVTSSEGVLDFKACDTILPIKQAGKDAKPMRVIGHGTIYPWGRVQVVPEVGRNLLSVSQLWNDFKWRHTADETVSFTDTLHDNNLVASGYLHPCGLYIVDNVHWKNLHQDHSTNPIAGTAAVATSDASPSQRLLEAHYKFGHLSKQGLAELHRHELLPQITADDLRRGFGTCAACISAKLHRAPRSKKARHATRSKTRFERISVDYCGPMSVETVDGNRGFMTFWDDWSGEGFTYLVRNKSQSLQVLQRFVADECIPRGLHIGTLRTDGAAEYTSAEFRGYCKEKGIKREITARHSPHQNPQAERGNRTLVEMATAQLHHAGLGKEWWGPSVLHATYTRNRCPSARLNGGIPFVVAEGRLPDYSKLMPFGVTAYVHVPDSLRTKFESKAVKGVYLGNSRGRNAYMIYLPERKIIVHSRDVDFELDAAGTRDFYQSKLQGTSNERYMGVSYTPVTSSSSKQKSVPAVASSHGDTNSAPPVPPQNHLTVDNIGKLSKGQLQEHLKKYKEKTSGNKPALKQRLREAMRAATVQSVPSNNSSEGVLRTPVSTHANGNDEEVPRTVESNAAHLTEFIEEQLFYQGYSFLASAETMEDSSSSSSSTSNSSSSSNSSNGSNSNSSNSSSNSSSSSSSNSSSSSSGISGSINNGEDNNNCGTSSNTDTPVLARDVATPNSYKQAVRSPQRTKWELAMDKELASLRDNSVFKIVPRPRDHPVLPTRWTYRAKGKSDGTIEKFKARFVAKGFLQQYLINYSETYAPVARLTTIRALLTLCAHWQWPVDQMDVVTAFLYADLREQVFCEAPEGYPVGDDECWELQRALYGLKQAPKEWFENLKAYLLTLGLVQSTSDPCIFLKREDGKLIAFVAVYVDDLLIAGANEEVKNGIKQALSEKYSMTDLGQLEWYLGMQITQDTAGGTTTISQRTYIDTVLERFGMADCAPCTTPMLIDPPTKEDCPVTDEDKQAMSEVPYRSAIGALMYLSVCTRPDIARAVNRLAKFVINPGQAHWKAVKRVLRYLQHTKEHGLKLTADDGVGLNAYVDASWGDPDQDRKSTTGFLCRLGSSPVSWSSYTQSSVARSSTEAEYMALSDATQEVVWLHRLLNELGLSQSAAVVFEDNQGCIKLAQNSSGINRRTKHIDVRYHYVKHVVHSGIITLKYCTTRSMVADILTKPLGKIRFEELRDLMGVHSIT